MTERSNIHVHCIGDNTNDNNKPKFYKSFLLFVTLLIATGLILLASTFPQVFVMVWDLIA